MSRLLIVEIAVSIESIKKQELLFE